MVLVAAEGRAVKAAVYLTELLKFRRISNGLSAGRAAD